MAYELSTKQQLRIVALGVLALLLFAATDSFASAAEYSLDSSYRKLKPAYPFIKPVRLRPEPAVRHWPAQQYRTVDGRALRMEVFAGPAAGDRGQPGLLLVHGGGWRAGDRMLLAPLAQQLAARGFVVASADYRLSHQASFPAPVQDLFTALQWLREQAHPFGLDPDRLAIGGASAGGQLAALVGLAGSDRQFNPGSVDPVQAVINIDGLWDFTTPLALRYENDPDKPVTAASAYLGARYEQQPARWRRASPVYYLQPGAPALLAITAENPRFSAGVEAAAARAQASGALFVQHHYADAPHSFWLFEPWFSQLVPQLEHFLTHVFSQPDQP